MSERDILDALARIEAKVDALTDWSGMEDVNARPLTKAELAEHRRLIGDAEGIWREVREDRETAAEA